MVQLRNTGYPPNLEMPPTCRNHLFVSHVWSSGQDKAHAITRNLQLYLPGLKIWIDVDSLEDIDRLEEYIAESAVVLIFYTKGYFQSVNCRREFYQAIALEKPIIVIHEDDDEALEEMKHECVTYCGVKFANDGIDINRVLEIILEDPIRRIKTGSFSAETLKLVYIRILKNLPYYRDVMREETICCKNGSAFQANFVMSR